MISFFLIKISKYVCVSKKCLYLCTRIVMMQTYLLNRCLNHHLGKAKGIYNSYWERFRRRFPIKNCGLW